MSRDVSTSTIDKSRTDRHTPYTADFQIKKRQYFFALERGCFQTVKNSKYPQNGKLDKIKAIFESRFARTESFASFQHRRHYLAFDNHTQTINSFLDEILQVVKKGSGRNTQLCIEVKTPPSLSKATMSGFMGKEPYGNTVKHFERELEKRRFGTAKEKPIPGRFTNQEKYLCYEVNKDTRTPNVWNWRENNKNKERQSGRQQV